MTQSIIIASLDKVGVEDISNNLGSEYSIIHIENTEECPEDIDDISAALIDHSFSILRTRNFINLIKSRKRLPIMVISDEQNAGFASQAIDDGAYNFIVKKGAYMEIIDFALKDSIIHFNEMEHLKVLNQELMERIEKIEQSAQQNSENSDVNKNAAATAPRKLNREIMQEIVKNLKSGEVNLPAYPGISQKFRKMVNEGESISSLASVLETDVSISSKMISVANSAYYKGMAPMKTLEQALGRIGMSEAGNYVELILNRSLYLNAKNKFGVFLEKLWKHSLACAYASKELSRTLYKGDPNEYFCLGLFHDLGKLLLIQIMSELEAKGAYATELQEGEWKEIVSKYHGQFGASLMKRWKLSREFTDVALYHERPERFDVKSNEINIVHMANLIVRKMGYTEKDNDEVDYSGNEVFADYKLSKETAEDVMQVVEESLQAGMVV